MTATNQRSYISEQFRTIRTNFLTSRDSQNCHTLVITSPNREDGKSTIAANFAISMAQQGKKVLLIDTDFRNSVMHSSFKIENSIGLSNVLYGNVDLKDAIHETEIRGFDLLPSGQAPLSPAELLGSKTMEIIIKEAIGIYEVVIFDSPPVLDLADAKIIANQCDGLILVMRWGKTKNNEAVEAKKIIESAKAKLIGVILNDCDK